MSRQRALRTGLMLTGAVGIGLGAGCSPSPPDGSSSRVEPASGVSAEAAAGSSIRTLPDLTSTDGFARQQIRSRHGSLLTTLDAPTSDPETRGEALGEMGKLLMAASLLAQAEPYFLHAQTEMPEDTRWPYYLGHLYATQGALERSVEAFERVLAMRPDDEVTMISLGDVHLSRGDPDAAEPLFRRQLAIQPDSVVANVGLGRVALERRDYRQAVAHLEEGLRLSGGTAIGVHYPLALAYRGLGDQEQAAEHMRQRADARVLPADPLMEELGEILENPAAYERRGNRALSRGDWTTAAEQFRRGLALDPDSPTLRHRLGTALFQLGDPNGAAAEWQRVVQTTPDFSFAHVSLAVLLEGAGLREEAIGHFEEAVRHEPTYVQARLGLAALLRRAGRLDESLVQYDEVAAQAVIGDPRFEEAPFGAAITLVQLGRYAEARDRLQAGMADHPGTPFFAHALARLWSAAPRDQVRDGPAALALVRSLPEALQRVDFGETLAMTLAEVGRYAEAATVQRDAVELATRAGRRDLLPTMRARLGRYESGRPWRHADPIGFDPFLERAPSR